MCNESLIFLFLNQNICCGYSKEPSQLDVSFVHAKHMLKIVSEYDQEIPQSQNADNPAAPRGRAAQPSRDTRKTIKQSIQLSLPHQDDCNTRMDIK